MIAGIHISQEIFVIDILTVLKPFLEHDRKLVLRLSRLYLDGDQALISCGLYIFCHLDISVESIGRFICCQDRSNEEPLFIRPQFGSQFEVFICSVLLTNATFQPKCFCLYSLQTVCKLQIRTLHALSFLVVDCGHSNLGFMVHLKRLLHIT